MVKLPSVRTSPLKRPAMRTLPDPSILPSMVRFAAMTDSPPSPRGAGTGRRGAAAKAASLEIRSLGAGRSAMGAGAGGAAPAGTGVKGSLRPVGAGPGVGFSFQSAIADSPANEDHQRTR